MSIPELLTRAYQRLLSHQVRERGEHLILTVSIVSFLVHLAVIGLVHLGWLPSSESSLVSNPIAAIYTPFSFILLYEVYLLIYYLPRSMTTYIGKQYEIMTLIVIRRLFKDLANLELSSNWFEIKYDLQFTYDIVASLLLFWLLLLYYRQSQKKNQHLSSPKEQSANIQRFIHVKKTIALLLVPVLVVMASVSLIGWAAHTLNPNLPYAVSFKNINNVFFDEFFTVLIITDVILLLVSFYYTDKFSKVIRNSGFIISTILIRLSFSVEGILNPILIVSAVVFSLLILTLHNQYEKDRLFAIEE